MADCSKLKGDAKLACIKKKGLAESARRAKMNAIKLWRYKTWFGNKTE